MRFIQVGKKVIKFDKIKDCPAYDNGICTHESNKDNPCRGMGIHCPAEIFYESDDRPTKNKCGTDPCPMLVHSVEDIRQLTLDVKQINTLVTTEFKEIRKEIKEEFKAQALDIRKIYIAITAIVASGVAGGGLLNLLMG